MSKASMARAIAKAGKKQEAQTRGLTGNRNAQGDFMPEEVQMKGVQDSVTPDVQKYIEDVKSQIDEIESRIMEIEQDPSYFMPADLPIGQGGSSDASSIQRSLEKQMDALTTQIDELLTDLVDKLEENGIPVPKEVRELQLEPYQRTEQYKDDIMRKAYEEEQAYQADLDAKYAADPDPTGGWAEWNSM